MLETFFLLFLLSGYLKGVLSAYGMMLPVDLTLLTGVLVLGYLGIQGWSGRWRSYWKHLIEARRPLGFLFLFWGWSIASAHFLSPSAHYGDWKSVLFGTAVLAFLAPAIHRRFDLRRFAAFFCLFSGLYGAFAFIVYALKGVEMLGLIGLHEENPFLGALYLKAGMLLSVAVILGFFLKRSHRVVAVNVLLILLLGTAARGPILGLLLIGGMVGAFRLFRSVLKAQPPSLMAGIPWPRAQKGGLLILLNLLVIGSCTVFEPLRHPFSRTAYRFSVLVPEEWAWFEKEGPEEAERVQAGRREHFLFAFQGITGGVKPLIRGHGFGSYMHFKAGMDKRGYPHNIILEVWFELGLLGLIPFLALLGLLLRRMGKHGQWVFLAGSVLFLLNAMKSYSIVDLREMYGLMALGAFVIEGDDPNEEKTGPS